MGMYRSKEDELAKLSSSIFVMNFPDKFSAKELWTVCKQYGTMVDTFIPDRRSKAGWLKMLNSKSYAHVVNAGPHQFHKKEDSPAIVLDETYANKTDSCLPLLGKVKDFTSLTNLNVVLANEGFVNVKPIYGKVFGVMIVFSSDGDKKRRFGQRWALVHGLLSSKASILSSLLKELSGIDIRGIMTT
ncbi:nucleotide-binding alpha-beta plait domain-containing protein [Tanacetum coccineum]